MSFTDLVQRKIAAGRAGSSPQAIAAAEREARFRAYSAPLIAAIEAMTTRLFDDPMFVSAMGRPEVALEPREEASSPAAGHVKLVGPVGKLAFLLSKQDGVWMFIEPEWTILEALHCRGTRYPQVVPVKGDLANLDAFMVLVEDHIANFIADIALSPAAHLLIPGPSPSTDFLNLTRF